MTWSLKISNGDLAIGKNNSLAIVTGTRKVVQDLLCWIKHPIGADPLNPDLGSFIENGEGGASFLVAGEQVSLPEDFQDLVVSEVRRLINRYMSIQQKRANQEIAQFSRLVTINEDELILRYEISSKVNYDTMYLTINLITAYGDVYNLDIPFQDAAIIRGF